MRMGFETRVCLQNHGAGMLVVRHEEI
jgi:hypothetical protein